MPKSKEELRAMSDEDLEALRNDLTAQAETLRLLRRELAREAEWRASHPTTPGHDIAGGGGIEKD